MALMVCSNSRVTAMKDSFTLAWAFCTRANPATKLSHSWSDDWKGSSVDHNNYRSNPANKTSNPGFMPLSNILHQHLEHRFWQCWLRPGALLTSDPTLPSFQLCKSLEWQHLIRAHCLIAGASQTYVSDDATWSLDNYYSCLLKHSLSSHLILLPFSYRYKQFLEAVWKLWYRENTGRSSCCKETKESSREPNQTALHWSAFLHHALFIESMESSKLSGMNNTSC